MKSVSKQFKGKLKRETMHPVAFMIRGLGSSNGVTWAVRMEPAPGMSYGGTLMVLHQATAQALKDMGVDPFPANFIEKLEGED